MCLKKLTYPVLLFITGVVIGFQVGCVSVVEPEEQVIVTIAVLNGVSLARNVNVLLESQDGSASEGTTLTLLRGLTVQYSISLTFLQMTILEYLEI